MNDTKYNGWTNYQTWAIALWLNNDQYTQSYCRDMATEALGNTVSEVLNNGTVIRTRRQVAVFRIASRLKDYVEDMIPEENNGTLFADMIGRAMCEADWREIAEHYLDDIEER